MRAVLKNHYEPTILLAEEYGVDSGQNGLLGELTRQCARTSLTSVCSPCMTLRSGPDLMTRFPAEKDSDAPHNELLTVIYGPLRLDHAELPYPADRIVCMLRDHKSHRRERSIIRPLTSRCLSTGEWDQPKASMPHSRSELTNRKPLVFMPARHIDRQSPSTATSSSKVPICPVARSLSFPSLRDTSSSQLQLSLSLPHGEATTGAKFSKRMKRLLCCAWVGEARLFLTEKPRTVQLFRGTPIVNLL